MRPLNRSANCLSSAVCSAAGFGGGVLLTKAIHLLSGLNTGGPATPGIRIGGLPLWSMRRNHSLPSPSPPPPRPPRPPPPRLKPSSFPSGLHRAPEAPSTSITAADDPSLGAIHKSL